MGNWTRPEAFRPVIEESMQPPFSEAYLSGDATGSHHTPVWPTPVEFLPLRWRRSAGRVQGLREDQAPEPPEHLSRAYLSAFLRDLGRYLRGNPVYLTLPDAQQRYPHLA